MQRSNNDMDKLFDLFLYLFPKYLNKISDPRNNRYTEKRPYINKNSERDVLQEYKIEDINDDGHDNQDTGNNQYTNEKDENKDNSSSTNDNGKDSGKEDDSSSGKHDSNIDSEVASKGEAVKSDNELEINEENLKENKGVSKGGEGMPDAVNAIDTAKEDIVISEVTDETTDTDKNESYNICVDGIEKILIELVGEKVDICITNSTMFLLNAVTILNAEDDIIKLRTSLNTIIVVPIAEIVAIRCNLIYGINFENNCNFEVCKKEEGLRRYFASIIGKKVSIQTKGEGEFKYISNRIVTGTGKGIVIVEGTIAISLSKITLVEEIT